MLRVWALSAPPAREVPPRPDPLRLSRESSMSILAAWVGDAGKTMGPRRVQVPNCEGLSKTLTRYESTTLIHAHAFIVVPRFNFMLRINTLRWVGGLGMRIDLGAERMKESCACCDIDV
jgi:hypothetical protein